LEVAVFRRVLKAAKVHFVAIAARYLPQSQRGPMALVERHSWYPGGQRYV